MAHIHPGADPSGAAIVDFGQVTGNSLTWTVNQQANTQLDLTIKDSTGISAQSAPFTVEAGSDIACLNATASSTQSTAGNTSATSGAATSTSSSATNTAVVTTSTSAAQTTTTAPATTSSKATSSAASTTSSAKPATTSNAAATQAASFGAAVLGAAAVALFA
ncbi:hypothetical protein H0H93_009199 [Arthromyces matolae]|nr:hypothetical protein H0H93_009199 [Arthromyces matolae]